MTPKNILILILFLSILLETTFVSFPLFLLAAVIFFVLYPTVESLIILLVGALTLDAVTASSFGSETLFVFAVLLAMSLYQKVLNIKDYKILLVMLFLFSLLFAYLFSYMLNFLVYLLIYGVIFTGLFISFRQKWIY